MQTTINTIDKFEIRLCNLCVCVCVCVVITIARPVSRLFTTIAGVEPENKVQWLLLE